MPPQTMAKFIGVEEALRMMIRSTVYNEPIRYDCCRSHGKPVHTRSKPSRAPNPEALNRKVRTKSDMEKWFTLQTLKPKSPLQNLQPGFESSALSPRCPGLLAAGSPEGTIHSKTLARNFLLPAFSIDSRTLSTPEVKRVGPCKST